jgi:hypothetical protein
MKLKFFVYCPDEEKIIKDIITTASKYGAGTYGNYSQVAFITYGKGNWKSEEGSKPFQGKVGKVTRASVVRIEMTCLTKNAKQVENAIKQIHPWEQVDIEFFRIEEI